jgi:hypothetical protein
MHVFDAVSIALFHVEQSPREGVNPGRGTARLRMDRMPARPHPSRMPSLSKWTPGMGSKALSVREHRSNAVMHTQRITLPARMVIDARAEATALHGRIVRACESANPADLQALPALVGAAVKVRSQLLDLLSLPTRPRGESRRRLLTLPPSDVSTVEPLPPDPRTIPGVPPIDA